MNRNSWREEDSEDPYVIPPYIPRSSKGNTNTDSKGNDSGAVKIIDPQPNATPLLSILQNSKSVYQTLVTANAKSGGTSIVNLTRPVQPLPPKCSHSADDYEEIADFPMKNSNIVSPSNAGVSSLRFPLQERKQTKKSSSGPPLQEKESGLTPYVKFMPTSPAAEELLGEVQSKFREMAEEMKNLNKKVTQLTTEVTEILQWKNQISYKLSNLKLSRETPGKTQLFVNKDMSPDEVMNVHRMVGRILANVYV